MMVELYNANQSGNPPYSYMRTPCWLQRAFDVINHCMAVDRERQAAREAAGGR